MKFEIYISNWKINERSNVERLNLRVINIGKKIQKIDSYQRTNMRISKIANSAEYRMDEQFQGWQFWSQILVCQIKFFFSNLITFQFGILQNFPILMTPRIYDSDNSKKFPNFIIFKITKFLKLYNFEK